MIDLMLKTCNLTFKLAMAISMDGINHDSIAKEMEYMEICLASHPSVIK